MIRKPIRIVMAAMAALALAGAANEAPRQVIDHAINKALEVLRDENLQKPENRQQRHARLRDVAARAFDWAEMARRSLGAHWRTATEQQQQRFVTVFKDLLAERYLRDIDRFRGSEEVFVGEAVMSDDTAAKVETTLVTHSREKIPINYFLHREGDRWLVHDVSIEGVSLVNHYRGTFNRFLVNNDMATLLDRLEQKQAGTAG